MAIDSATANADPSTDSAVTGRERSLANLRPWNAGESGNPTGRRDKGLVAYIKEQTLDGTELVDYVLSVMRDPDASTRHRLQAADWLGDRGWGRPAQSLELKEDEQPSLSVIIALMSPEERRAYAEQRRREIEAEQAAREAEEADKPLALPALTSA